MRSIPVSARILPVVLYVYLTVLALVFYTQYGLLTRLWREHNATSLARENSVLVFVRNLEVLRPALDCRRSVLFLADVPGLWGDFFVERLGDYALSPCRVTYVLQKPLPGAGYEKYDYIFIHKTHGAFAAVAAGRAPSQWNPYTLRRATGHYQLLERQDAP